VEHRQIEQAADCPISQGNKDTQVKHHPGKPENVPSVPGFSVFRFFGFSTERIRASKRIDRLKPAPPKRAATKVDTI
jgi:hypothetical protein